MTPSGFTSAGDEFYFSKIYELINFLTGKDLKGWYKSTYKLTDTYFMWIVALDGKERAGWKNVLLKDGRIKENFVGDKSNPPSNIRETFDYPYRAVFEKTKDSYIFKGVYTLDVENILFERYYVKFSDETTLYDF